MEKNIEQNKIKQERKKKREEQQTICNICRKRISYIFLNSVICFTFTWKKNVVVKKITNHKQRKKKKKKKKSKSLSVKFSSIIVMIHVFLM